MIKIISDTYVDSVYYYYLYHIEVIWLVYGSRSCDYALRGLTRPYENLIAYAFRGYAISI